MIYSLGSINKDYFYSVAQLPRPGETVPSGGFEIGLGGKGANMSVAAAQAGSAVCHIGAIGPDGEWALNKLSGYGVEKLRVSRSSEATGHAIVTRDEAGENAIVVYPGANRVLQEDDLALALSTISRDDVLLLQNETNGQKFCAELAREKSAKVIYAAAPFDAATTQDILPLVDVLVLNAIEADQLTQHLKCNVQDLNLEMVIVTKGADGASVFSSSGQQEFAAPQVKAVDTTGAGDTFTGFFVAGLDQGRDVASSVSLAIAAASLQVTRKGTTDAIPSLKELEQFQTA